jgi:hypothetical protein
VLDRPLPKMNSVNRCLFVSYVTRLTFVFEGGAFADLGPPSSGQRMAGEGSMTPPPAGGPPPNEKRVGKFTAKKVCG